jgi:hypothetical protein
LPELIFEIQGGEALALRMRIHAAEVDRLIREAIDDIALYSEGLAKAKAGFKTGNLRRNITRTRAHETRPNHHSAAVGVSRQAPYGVYTHEGTGIFGKHHRVITPHTGNVLVFRIGNRVLFRPSVKGQRANPFIRDAYIETNMTYAPRRIDKLGRDLSQI